MGLKSRAFWTMVHDKGLPHYKLNDRVFRFRWCEIETWLAQRKRGDALLGSAT